ncbi:glycosyltransferase family 4 protein [Thalassotalea sp. LPB0316]|uniref:glycosyltransferase family 4 protein n=1 Tax=Thalassotalea sp. LPB0316 TaxID=2769490 RepID=UPI001867662A|nr:glycosyltransferase family 4 protein [Thalassotalea sp. LPB0316]QOL24421.1 glycosyltransferase family 4 protein [Thalassotalea sp. LPB0316]
MHILFFTDNFPPESNAPASRTFEHAREWVNSGHKVTVITGVPNFPEGKVYENYQNKWYQKEYIEGIEVRRVKTYIAANAGFFRRILDFTSFMVTSFIAGFFVKKVDVVVGTSPQFFTTVSAWGLSALTKKPFVFELRDIWPASIKAVGAVNRSWVVNWLEKLELFLYRKADLIIAVTNSFKENLINRGIDGEKIEVVLNGVDDSKFKPVSEKNSYFIDKLSLDDKFVVGYLGTHGMAHGLPSVIDAAELLKGYKNIHFLFVGSGVVKQQLIALAKEKELENITFIPRQRKEMMPQFWGLCDVSLISLKKDDLFTTVIPSKVFESMGMGLPMITSAPPGEVTTLVKTSGSGIVISPENSEELAAAISKLHSNKSLTTSYAKSSYLASKLYCRRALAKDMLEAMVRLIK